jgi:hypothetical protein
MYPSAIDASPLIIDDAARIIITRCVCGIRRMLVVKLRKLCEIGSAYAVNCNFVIPLIRSSYSYILGVQVNGIMNLGSMPPPSSKSSHMSRPPNSRTYLSQISFHPSTRPHKTTDIYPITTDPLISLFYRNSYSSGIFHPRKISYVIDNGCSYCGNCVDTLST